jgi:hypothetical protein
LFAWWQQRDLGQRPAEHLAAIRNYMRARQLQAALGEGLYRDVRGHGRLAVAR